jgi:hypothetical protein
VKHQSLTCYQDYLQKQDVQNNTEETIEVEHRDCGEQKNDHCTQKNAKVELRDSELAWFSL